MSKYTKKITENYHKNVPKDLPKTPFKIHEGTIRKDFEKLHLEGKSILVTDQKYVVFCGITELTDRSCVHMELRNPTDKTIIFNVRTPSSPNFYVKPHVGMIEGKKKATLFFTFKAKCHRVPSDYCWIYSIYHISIGGKETLNIKDDEFSSTTLRSTWNRLGRGDIQNILHLSCTFDETTKPKTECKHHKIQKKIYLNDTGEVDNVVEEESKCSKERVSREKGEMSDSELPKTAEN